MTTVAARAPAAGFADPVLDGQAAFRATLEAMAHPGRIVEMPTRVDAPPVLHAAAAAALLTLVDYETPVWLDALAARDDVVRFLRFHCGCPIVANPAEARFALLADPASLEAIDRFAFGTDESPEDGATLVVQARRLITGCGVRLTGPGIVTEHRIRIDGVADAFWAERRRMQSQFPRGIDIVFTCTGDLAALPRSTAVRA